MTIQEQEQRIREQLTESMPRIIGALKLKLNMLQREQEVARVHGKYELGNEFHMNYLAAEVIATKQLIKKLEK